MRTCIMAKNGSRARSCGDKIGNLQKDKFVHDDRMLKAFKQVIVHKDTVFSSDIRNFMQHYKQFYTREGV